MSLNLRLIEAADNPAIEKIIRTVLTEFGANKPGFAWQDASLSALSSAYQTPNSAYWVAVDGTEVIGGCGIAPLQPGINDVCELQKMYVRADYRKTGVGKQLMQTALEFAQIHYQWCYLETLNSMQQAELIYRKNGFIQLPKPLILTEHSGCDRWYLKEFTAL